MSKLNAVWHRVHRMPKNPTLTKRIKWHRGHAQHCACREIPLSIKRLLKLR